MSKPGIVEFRHGTANYNSKIKYYDESIPTTSKCSHKSLSIDLQLLGEEIRFGSVASELTEALNGGDGTWTSVLQNKLTPHNTGKEHPTAQKTKKQGKFVSQFRMLRETKHAQCINFFL